MLGPSRPSTTVLIVTLVVVGLALAGSATTAGASGDSFIYLTSSTTPDQPTTSGEFTFTATLRSAEASDDPVELERIELRDGPGSNADVLAERSYFGRPNPKLAPGEALDQDFSIEFDEPGIHQVVVEVTFRESGGQRDTVTYPVNVTVYQPDPGIEVNAAPTAPGKRTALNVTVANGREDAIRDVNLALAGDDVSFDENARIASSIQGGATRSFGFDATPASLGSHPIDVSLEYTTADGTRRRTTRTVDVRFRSPDFGGDVGLAVDVAPAVAGGETTLNLTVANGLDEAIRQYEVQIEAEDVSIRQRRRVGTGFQSGAERTFSFDVSRPEPGSQPVDVTVTYTTEDGNEGQVTETLDTTFSEPANPGEIRLTGLEAVEQGGRLEISATASNVGSSPVESVVVAVGDASKVAGADYFVGSVDGSDFATFTLTTSVTGNVSSVPLEVTYVVDGVEQSFTAEVPVEQRVVQRPDDGGGSIPLIALLALVVLVVVGAVVYRRRR